MSRARGVLILLLAIAFVLSGGVLDLCTCGSDGHGLFCADGPDAAGCHTPQPSCCTEPRPAADAGDDCGCPVLELGSVTAEPPPAALPAADRATSFGQTPPPPRWIQLGRVAAATRQHSIPPPGPVRLHLLLSVFRC